MSNKTDKRIDQATDQAHTLADKATETAREVAHAAAGELRALVEKSGDAVKKAGERIRKLMH